MQQHELYKVRHMEHWSDASEDSDRFIKYLENLDWLVSGLSTTDFLGEKHRRQTKKLKHSAPAEVVQPLPNLPAPAEVCPASVSPAEVCSSWTKKSSHRRNFYTVNAPKFT